MIESMDCTQTGMDLGDDPIVATPPRKQVIESTDCTQTGMDCTCNSTKKVIKNKPRNPRATSQLKPPRNLNLLDCERFVAWTVAFTGCFLDGTGERSFYLELCAGVGNFSASMCKLGSKMYWSRVVGQHSKRRHQ